MTYKYLALGDSYTIGEAVTADQRWPHVLQGRLVGDGIKIEKPEIIAATGWTTDELQAAIEMAKPAKHYDLVSLLIGVNNQYRGYPIRQYKVEFEALLVQAIGFAQGKPAQTFVVSIPDYGVTPFAAAKNTVKIAREIEEYNRIAQVFCSKYQVAFVDITADSRRASSDPALIAEDGLHPSEKMYKKWVEAIYPVVKPILK
ncbi:SGNH/GDSL hydrolase family protein [Reichenbachiella carrageenanivorans]|uniref:SGNH/GDSL hydrolase family protein n=1 Tax=Reichenbachiella carrageenanivorans TaxID=2979869 RepID=A0ABY6D1H5_9BACT|nr:SGNH/GDSL hydrolase family protein [Reichenbachiella carrageenanivorans]UXX80020.1 SGNH/GDSL hydrolase family protein [Reichenbachiella carrageenanivorans]